MSHSSHGKSTFSRMLGTGDPSFSNSTDLNEKKSSNSAPPSSGMNSNLNLKNVLSFSPSSFSNGLNSPARFIVQPMSDVMTNSPVTFSSSNGGFSRLVASNLMKKREHNFTAVSNEAPNAPKPQFLSSKNSPLMNMPTFTLPESPLHIFKRHADIDPTSITSIVQDSLKVVNKIHSSNITSGTSSVNLICDRFEIKNKIGGGSFGEIFVALDTLTSENVALKREKKDSKRLLLEHEFTVYQKLKSENGKPLAFWYGSDNENNWLGLQLLGPSLEDVFSLCNRLFSIKTVLILADQLLYCVESLHQQNFLHRDIKPENFLLGPSMAKLDESDFDESAWKHQFVYMIDFGLSCSFVLPNSNEHIPFKRNKTFTGTNRYASVSAHHGFEQSRRDDLESLGFMLINLAKGKLPWEGLSYESNSPYDFEKKRLLILGKKVDTSIEELCSNLPTEFELYMMYCRSLEFEVKPDYSYLRSLFRTAFKRLNFVNDGKLDWDELNSKLDPNSFLAPRRTPSLNVFIEEKCSISSI